MRPDEELLAATPQEPRASAEFYRRHARELTGYFLRRTGSTELAADLTAETFAAALEGARRFRPERGPAIAWLYGIARRKLADALQRGRVEDRARRRLRMPRLVLDDEALEEVERAADAAPTGARLSELLDDLPADQRGDRGARRPRARLPGDRTRRAHVRIRDPQARVARPRRAAGAHGETQMTSFFGQLEQHLSEAAERQARRRGFHLPAALRLRSVLGGLAVAAVAALVAGAVVRSGADRDHEVPATPPGAGVTLHAATPAAYCEQASSPVFERTDAFADEFKVLRRTQHEPDGFPVLDRSDAGRADPDDLSWLPFTRLDPRLSRRPRPDRFRTELYLLFGSGVQTAEGCAAGRRPAADDGPGACLVIGAAGGPLETSCHTREEIRAGRAIALSMNAEGVEPNLFGIVPDGYSSVVVENERRPGYAPLAEATVVENAFEVELGPGFRRGDRVRVRLVPYRQAPTCAGPAPPLRTGTRCSPGAATR